MYDEERTEDTQTPAPAPVNDELSLIDSMLAPEDPAEGNLEDEQPEVTDVVTADDSHATDSEEEDDTEAEEEGEVEESEDDEEAEEGSEETEDAEEDADEEEGSDSEEEEEEPESDIVWELDGEGLTLDDLKTGYLKNADYTQKTQALAEEKQVFAQQVASLQAHEQTVAENLTLALQVIEPQLVELQNTDWDGLLQSDAYEYQQKRGELEQAQMRYAALQERGQQMLAQRQQQTERAQEAFTTAERQKLRLALPDLADPKTGRDLAHRIKEYALNDVGLSPQEADNMVDHRLIVVLNKARQFDELQNAGLSVAQKKIKKGPKKTISSGKPQSLSKRTARKQQNAKDRLAATGSTEALVDILTG